jgi:hypothetical protein
MKSKGEDVCTNSFGHLQGPDPRYCPTIHDPGRNNQHARHAITEGDAHIEVAAYGVCRRTFRNERTLRQSDEWDKLQTFHDANLEFEVKNDGDNFGPKDYKRRHNRQERIETD